LKCLQAQQLQAQEFLAGVHRCRVHDADELVAACVTLAAEIPHHVRLEVRMLGCAALPGRSKANFSCPCSVLHPRVFRRKAGGQMVHNLHIVYMPFLALGSMRRARESPEGVASPCCLACPHYYLTGVQIVTVQVKLVVIDSIAAPFRAVEGHQFQHQAVMLTTIARMLRRIAALGVAVVVTNHVVGGRSSSAEDLKPALGV
jgi:Rad51